MNAPKPASIQQNQQPTTPSATTLQSLITLHQKITRDLNHALTAYQEILHNTQIAQEHLINLYQAAQGSTK